MLTLCTYHPAALLHAGKNSPGGPSRESILLALREDFKRLTRSQVLSPPEVGIPEGTILGIDTEYGGRSKDELYTIAVGDRDKSISWDKDLSSSDSYESDQLRRALGRAEVLIGHNIPEDIRLLWENNLIPKKEGYVTGESLRDSLLLAKMAQEERPSFKLEDLLAGYYTVEGWKKETRGEKDASKWDPADRAERCRRDAWGAYRVAEVEIGPATGDSKAPYGGGEGARTRFEEGQALLVFTHRVQQVLHRLSCAGAVIDLGAFGPIKDRVGKETFRIMSRLQGLASSQGMGEFDPDNDGHLRELLYEKLGCAVLKKTAKAKVPSVERDTLNLLSEKAEGVSRTILELLVDYSIVSKINSTYVEGLESLFFPAGLIEGAPVAWLPFNFHAYGAKTGRRSSSKPNSQNWPKPVLKLVRSRWLGGQLLSADYRKLEPRIIACLAKSDKLLTFFTTGGGYIDIAKELFHTDVKEGTPLYRGVKSVVLGVHYDERTDKMAYELWTMDPPIRFSEDWNAHWEFTDRIRNAYLASFPEIGRYMDRRRIELAGSGQIRSPIGRLRRLGSNPDKHTANQAINYPVQSTGGDITGSALVDVEAALIAEAGLTYVEWYDTLLGARKRFLRQEDFTHSIMPDCRVEIGYEVPTVFNEVHDSLWVDLPPEWVKRGMEIVVESMRAVPTFRSLCPYLKDIPLDVDVKVGPRLGG